MFLLRLVFALLLAGGVLCFAMYIGTRRPVWRARTLLLIKWTVIAALGFVAVLILERLAIFL